MALSFKAAYVAAAKQVAKNTASPNNVETSVNPILRHDKGQATPLISQSSSCKLGTSNQKLIVGVRKQNLNSTVKLIKSRKEIKNSLLTKPLQSTPRYNSPAADKRQPKTAPPHPEQKPQVRLTFKGEPQVSWKPVSHIKNLLEGFNEQLGRLTSICKTLNAVPREVVMGVDFGTSSTKVVVGDRSMKAAYAVPFTQMAGVSAYLLPTHLNEVDGIYDLSSNGIIHSDLKLSMLSDPSNIVSCARVSAYLALVIRASRAWLFSALKEQYLAADVVWSVAIGQPADQATSSKSQALFKKLGKVAWYLAGCREELSAKFCLNAWHGFDSGAVDPGDIEVLVMPELAAQIYGFVSSIAFDPKQPNIYLLVDVGAGTVDASVFRVKKGVGGTASFSFFTNAVEAYGTMNLHRHRVSWWQNELLASSNAEKVIADLESIRLPTEYRGALPEIYTDYVDNIEVSFESGILNPDQEFFQKVRNQVAGKVLFGAYKNNLLDQASIAGMPFFLCGGGARYGFYKKLKTEMQKQQNCSWLNATYRELTLPSMLRADGVGRSDYDRLSVAYGLSQLDVASVLQVDALRPRVPVSYDSNWSSNYIDKSAV